jgi:uncharacterized protein
MEEEISFKNSSGDNLKGYLHDEGDFKNGILLAHCFTCSRHVKLMRKMCDYLAGRNFLVLRFDFSGNGESEGKFEEATYSKEIGDFNSAAKILLKKGVKSIGGLGHSMGSAVTILAGNKNPNVKVLASISGASSTQSIEHIFTPEQLNKIYTNGSCNVNLFGKNLVMKKDFFDDAKRHSISDSLKNSKKPYLVIHGDKDTILSSDNAKRLFFYSGAKEKRLELIKGADHMFLKDEYMDRALKFAGDWFGKYLR